jgi:hypothetical protein
MEDDLNCFQMEDDLNIFSCVRRSLFMEDILNFWVNERRPQYFGKWKTTSILWQMEDDLNILANGI